MAKDGYIPLAKVGKGKTLCASDAQDRYFVVSTGGERQALTLQEAVQLYLRAAEQPDKLVWKRKFKRSAKSMETIAAEEEHAELWADKLRKSLGMHDEDERE